MKPYLLPKDEELDFYEYRTPFEVISWGKRIRFRRKFNFDCEKIEDLGKEKKK